jgi:cysteine desulfurase / selenocysteine lyase
MSEVLTAPDALTLKAQFPALHQTIHGFPLTYLDSAATAQKPRCVIDAVTHFYENDNANVHRGLYELARRATDAYEAARVSVARFLNAPSSDEVVWVRGTTEAINLVATSWGNSNIRTGDEILLSVLEHHSNLVPWQMLAERTGARLRFIDIDDQGRLRLEQLDDLLTSRTKLVAIGHISNALGTINPVAHICERAHAVGALVLVDGAQGAAHLRADVQAVGCDFYAFSSHKLGGPMGVGALWGRADLLELMPPYHGGGEMIERVELERSTYAKPPHRFEAGTPNVADAVGLAAAIDFLESIGTANIYAIEQELVLYGLERLGAVKGLRLFGPTTPEDRAPVFSFELDGIHPHDIATILDERGIAVRAGHHCAQPLMRRLAVPATTRASCYLYTTTADLDTLAEALDAVKKVFA